MSSAEAKKAAAIALGHADAWGESDMTRAHLLPGLAQVANEMERYANKRVSEERARTAKVVEAARRFRDTYLSSDPDIAEMNSSVTGLVQAVSDHEAEIAIEIERRVIEAVESGDE